MAIKQKIVSNLWFDTQAEEAANYYISIFKDGKIGRISRYNSEGHEAHGQPEGAVMTVEFTLNGHDFLALNGGPAFKFSEAVSFVIYCDTQEEIDYYWEALKKDGDEKAQECGWLKDKYGLSWQVVPTMLDPLFDDYKSEKARRVMKAMLKMKKLDIEELQKAYDGK